MKDLIIFNVKDSTYAVDIENVQRIVQAQELTRVPNAHPFVDGMMSFEDRVIKIVNFRKMLNFESYTNELKNKFDELKGQHNAWIEDLKKSIDNGVEFNKTLDPHSCELGVWLDGFTSYDDHVSKVLKELNSYHKSLHKSGHEVLELLKKDPESALRYFAKEVMGIYGHTMGYLDQFIAELEQVSSSLQKLLLYHTNSGDFAIKVDDILDIAHIEDSALKKSSDNNHVSEFLELDGVLELNGTLINVIKSIKMPN